MTGGRTLTLFTRGVRQYLRTPVLLLLLVLLPADMVGLVMRESSDMIVPLSVTGGGTLILRLQDVTGVFMGPLAAAVVGGIFGLFVMQRARDADSRLAIAGFRPFEVVLARLGLIAVACLLVTGVVVVVLTTQFTPEYLPLYAVAVFLAAISFGMIGALLGLMIDRLAGLYAMLFVPMVDILLFQNPISPRSLPWASALPGHHVTQAAIDASFGEGFDELSLLLAVAYVCVLVAVTTGAFHRTVTGT